jgi:hypothetical protein
MLLNGLYGKFGQRGGQWTLDKRVTPILDFGVFWQTLPLQTEPQKYLCLYDKCFRWVPDQEVPMSSPAISAFVTSYGRQRMRHLKDAAGHGHYYYQATDSLIVDAYGRYNLECAGEISTETLGKLRLEKTGLFGWIGGLNWYALGDKIVEGGKKSGAQTLSETEWEELCFENLLSVWTRGGEPFIDITRVNKRRQRAYTKGDVMENGAIRPWRFAEAIGK